MTIARWEKFKHFFQITIFRYLVVWFSVVPILAAAFESFPDNFVLALSDNSHLLIKLTLPFNWQLLWLSSLFFLIAWTIYLIRCPAYVKQYNRYSDYTSYGHDPRWLVWEAKKLINFEYFESSKKQLREKFVQRLTTKKYLESVDENSVPNKSQLSEPLVEQKQTCIYFPHENKWYRFAMPIIENGEPKNDAERELFWEIFGRFSGSRWWSRLLITLFLVLSAALFVCVLCQHIIVGFNYVLSWFFQNVFSQ